MGGSSMGTRKKGWDSGGLGRGKGHLDGMREQAI